MKASYIVIIDSETYETIYEESHEYVGPVDKCCGPGGAEMTQAANEENFATTLQNDYSERFAGQSGTINNLSSVISALQNGQMVPGFSNATMTALTSQNLDTTSGEYANAARALNNQIAGTGGGGSSSSGLTSGPAAQLKEQLASAAAGTVATNQQNIQLANQNQASQNEATVIGGLNALAGAQSPIPYASATNQAEGQAFGQANQITNMFNSKESAEAGAAMSLGMDALTGGIGALAGIGGGGGITGVPQDVSGGDTEAGVLSGLGIGYNPAGYETPGGQG